MNINYVISLDGFLFALDILDCKHGGGYENTYASWNPLDSLEWSSVDVVMEIERAKSDAYLR